MSEAKKLYMIILGATPKGRLTEQHDVFFGIANNLAELVPQMKAFWPQANGKIHIDSWREVTEVDGYEISIVERKTSENGLHLFFINLGGYKENDPEEYHYKVLAVATTLAEASKISKQTAFYKHVGFEGAVSHIDDKHGLDIDDMHNVNDILDAEYKSRFSIGIKKSESVTQDKLHIGYLKIDRLEK